MEQKIGFIYRLGLNRDSNAGPPADVYLVSQIQDISVSKMKPEAGIIPLDHPAGGKSFRSRKNSNVYRGLNYLVYPLAATAHSMKSPKEMICLGD